MESVRWSTWRLKKSVPGWGTWLGIFLIQFVLLGSTGCQPAPMVPAVSSNAEDVAAIRETLGLAPPSDDDSNPADLSDDAPQSDD